MNEYWYPVGWKCSHSVDLKERRCLACDRLIDWKRMWLASQQRVCPKCGSEHGHASLGTCSEASGEAKP